MFQSFEFGMRYSESREKTVIESHQFTESAYAFLRLWICIRIVYQIIRGSCHAVDRVKDMFCYGWGVIL